MAQRLVYRTRLSYNTPSNRVKVIKTPGGNLRYLHIAKKAGAPKCGDCGEKLMGIPSLRPTGYKRLSRNLKTVSRAYGGSRCAKCVRERILRAFLLDEQKIVKKVLKAKKVTSGAKTTEATPAATTTKDEKQKKKATTAGGNKKTGAEGAKKKGAKKQQK